MEESSRLIGSRYQLKQKVGQGAMGVVWQAYDEQLHRVVAAKELLALDGLDDARVDRAKARAMREARLAARLEHPNAIRVYDVVEEDGRPWLIMEYLPSRSLAAVITEQGTLPPREVARIGCYTAAALAAAHRHGIQHRDVKPGNVLIGDQEVKITDFGISRATGDDATATATGTVGTPAFFSPEVARGEDAGLPSDVFSLGATLYNAVEGGPPFGTADNHLAMLHRVAGGSIMPPANAGPLLSPVLFRLLATDPARRPSMQEAVHLLAAVVNETPQVSEATAVIPATVKLPVEAQPEAKAAQESAAAAAGLVAGAAAAEAAGLVSRPGSGAAAAGEAGAAAAAAGGAAAGETAATASEDAAAGAAGKVAADEVAAEQLAAERVAADEAAAAAAAASVAAEKAAAEKAAVERAAAQKAAAERAAAQKAETDRAAAEKAAAERAAAESARIAAAATAVAAPAAVTPASTPPVPPSQQDEERRKFPLVPILIVLLVIAVGVGSFLLWPKGGTNNNAQPPASDNQTGGTTTGQTTGQTTEQSQPQQPGSSQEQPPANSATQPPANTPSQPQAPAGPKNAQEAITAYYALIPGNLQEGYSLLTEQFKATKAGSYENYQSWWGKYSGVQVSNPVPQGENGITVTLTYMKGGAVDTTETSTFTFVQQNGKWLINSQA
ncbi:protein kinase [Lentzea sp. NPDC058450]|uniref:serine/threonine-protein kinase n=1 Tax=Lentzea sp. NPDC058450 TaxID=3346505 RepID=UPI0036538CCD